MKHTTAWFYSPVLLFIGVIVSGMSSALADNNSRLYRPVDNWNVDGANGVLYVSGSLTESPCRLAMESASQSVNLGNTETADLPKMGSKGRSIPFNITLLDCIEMNSVLENLNTGQTAWSSKQPAAKIRFVAATVPFMPQYARVAGAQGIGLEITTPQGKGISLNNMSVPLLISPGDNVLTYYVTPVRISDELLPDAYSAIISFEMIYE